MSVLEAQLMLRGLDKMNLIGADMVEVAPPYDPTGNTAMVTAIYLWSRGVLSTPSPVCATITGGWNQPLCVLQVGAQLVFEMACLIQKSRQLRSGESGQGKHRTFQTYNDS